MNLDDIKKAIDHASSIVFFGGAGTSTESNIPDFRTAGGLYSRRETHGMAPEELLSHGTLVNKPDIFFEYYRNNLIYPDAKPNATHKVLSEWEAMGKLRAVITQNIDGLHQLAGSENVLELHGSVHRNYCVDCQRQASLSELLKSTTTIPACADCGGMIRPDVVLYGEALDMGVMRRAVDALQEADFLIVGGTSLVVYPAAGLIDYYSGENLLLINRDPTPYDNRAKWVIHDSIGKVLEMLNEG